jgi:hypothetical protein
MEDFISKIEKFIRNNPIVSIFAFVVIAIFVITSKYATNIGIVGGIIILYLSFKRFNQTEKQINLTEDNNLNTTFKDAVTLLGSDNVSVRMGGVHTLIDIAKKNPNKYSKRINDILCNYIVEQTNKVPYNKRNIQGLIDLVIIENSETFKDFPKNLSRATFKEIFFRPFPLGTKEKINIYDISFSDSTFDYCIFLNLKLNNILFDKSKIKKLQFSSVNLDFCNFRNIEIDEELLFCPYDKDLDINNNASILNYCTFNQKEKIINQKEKIIFFNTIIKNSNIKDSYCDDKCKIIMNDFEGTITEYQQKEHNIIKEPTNDQP